VAQSLSDYDDDDELRVAIVTEAGPKAVRVVLASGEALRLEGPALRQIQPGLAANARPSCACAAAPCCACCSRARAGC
jgi:penicillin-binding protein 1A